MVMRNPGSSQLSPADVRIKRLRGERRTIMYGGDPYEDDVERVNFVALRPSGGRTESAPSADRGTFKP
jgi:hypothetical protein